MTFVGFDLHKRYITACALDADGAIVATRSVVVTDIPAYAIVGGNPAKVIRRRFSDEIVAALLDIAWWDWSVTKISRNLERIMAADIDALRTAA